MRADERTVVIRQRQREFVVSQCLQPEQHPQAMSSHELARCVSQSGSRRNDRLVTEVINEPIRDHHPALQVIDCELRDEKLGSLSNAINPHCGLNRSRDRRIAAVRVADIGNLPDAASEAIAARMRQRDFVVTDDLVVEVGDIHRSVLPEDKVDRTEPRISRRQKVRLFLSLHARTTDDQRVAIDAARHDVSVKQIAAIDRRKATRIALRDSGDGR